LVQQLMPTSGFIVGGTSFEEDHSRFSWQKEDYYRRVAS
jgi:hypothetical protein